MIKSETAKLLALIAAYDRRTVGEADVEAWTLTLANVRLADAMEVVVEYYKQRREWMMPADVVERAATLRRDRLLFSSVYLLTPPEEIRDLEYEVEREWRRRAEKLVADGLEVDQARTEALVSMSAEVEQAKAIAARASGAPEVIEGAVETTSGKVPG